MRSIKTDIACTCSSLLVLAEDADRRNDFADLQSISISTKVEITARQATPFSLQRCSKGKSKIGASRRSRKRKGLQQRSRQEAQHPKSLWLPRLRVRDFDRMVLDHRLAERRLSTRFTELADQKASVIVRPLPIAGTIDRQRVGGRYAARGSNGEILGQIHDAFCNVRVAVLRNVELEDIFLTLVGNITR